MLHTNVIGVFLSTRAAVPELRKSRGAVINVGSTVVYRSRRGRFGYVASKGAVEAMSRAWAVDLGPDGIRVNIVRPGLIPSELRGSTEEDEQARFGETVAALQGLPAVGSGADVAAAVAYLGSEEAGWLTSSVITVDGGSSLGRRD